MKKTFSLFFILIASIFVLSACGGTATQNSGTTPAPVTGEAAQKPGELKIYQVNPDGTKVEINNVSVTQETQQPPTATVLPDVKGMIITANGFDPATMSFKAGTRLIIQNEDTTLHEPSSDPHPSHDRCPELNAEKPLAKGESYEVIFTEPKVCGIHDHLNPSMSARIIVTR